MSVDEQGNQQRAEHNQSPAELPAQPRASWEDVITDELRQMDAAAAGGSTAPEATTQAGGGN